MSWEDFLQNGLKLSAYFSTRGYPIELTSKAFLDTNCLSRNDILAEKSNSPTENTDKKLFLILDFNPSLPPIKEWLLELWPILYKSSGTRKLVDVKPTIGYRRPKIYKISWWQVICQKSNGYQIGIEFLSQDAIDLHVDIALF